MGDRDLLFASDVAEQEIASRENEMMMLTRIAVLATTAGVIASAQAAGMTYLDCTMVDSRGDTSKFTVSLDETPVRWLETATRFPGKFPFVGMITLLVAMLANLHRVFLNASWRRRPDRAL